MKVLIADKFEAVGVEALEQIGCDVVLSPGSSADDLPSVLGSVDPDVLVVRSTKVRDEAIRAGTRLKLIVRAGAGYDTIDVAAASSDSIYVANCPGKNAVAVAELCWALILSCDRRVPDQTAELRNGQWNKKRYAAARGLFGATLGILGFGTIGREVALRGRAFGMRVVVWSRTPRRDQAQSLGLEWLDSAMRVAEQADVLSIHVASTPDTKHFVNREMIDAMKPGACVINTSRGAVVDEQALLAGIREKNLRAGLDVFDSEPGASTGDFDSAIAKEPGVYGTHHIGASTSQAQQAIAMEAVRVIREFRATGLVENCVNRAKKSPATNLLTVRHRNRPGVLAQVFDVLSKAGINVEEMENILYEGYAAACARIQLGRTPTPEHLRSIQTGCDDILSLELTEME